MRLIQNSVASMFGIVFTVFARPSRWFALVSAMSMVGIIATQSVQAQTKFKVLHTFNGYPSDGGGPYGTLIRPAGNLYGTTTSGGTYGAGTVFKVS